MRRNLVKYNIIPPQVPQENLLGEIEEDFAARRMLRNQPVRARWDRTRADATHFYLYSVYKHFFIRTAATKA